mmetsp:Transcript_29295/g.58485  ORF Transcript_29295/g.58485 Transcript_29295/m.58485 type:complete len:704 (-) Transcript_29295:295-2406(-)
MNGADDRTISSTRTGATTLQTTTSSLSRRSGSTSSSTKKKKKPTVNPEDIAATRHLRLIVESIAENSSLTPRDKAARMKNFEMIVENVEKQLHYNPSKGGRIAAEDAPENLLDVGKKKGVRRDGASRKNKGEKKSLFNHFLKRKDSQKSKRRDIGMVASPKNKLASVLEGLEEAREEVEEQRKIDAGVQEPNQDPERFDVDDFDNKEGAFATKEVDLDDDATCTDSIIDARMANSEDYTASICSIRSLGTFEKDFIQNIIAEQEAQCNISVSTFEQDMRKRNTSNMFVPTQVDVGDVTGAVDDNDELTLGDAQSETTFEQDAKKNGLVGDETNPGAAPPMLINVSSEKDDEDDHDDLTVEDARSETTFEQDAKQQHDQVSLPQQHRQQPQPVTQVSAFPQKQPNPQAPSQAPASAAASASAPAPAQAQMPTQAPNNYTTTSTNTTTANTNLNIQPTNVFIPNQIQTAPSTADSERSVSTFEKDARARDMLAKKIGRVPSTNPRSPMSDMATRRPPPDDASANTFEKDFKVRNSFTQKKPKTPLALDEVAEAEDDNLMTTPKFNPDHKPSSSEPPFVPPTEISVTLSESKASCGSEYGIEKDAKNITKCQPNPTKLGNDELLGFEKDVSRNMVKETAPKTLVQGGGLGSGTGRFGPNRPNATPSTNLVVELSPNAIDQGLKKGRSPGFFGAIFSRGMCHASLVP